MDFFSFERAALRLKEALSIQTDKELASALGMDASAFNKRKTRGSFPLDELEHLAASRPELRINVDFILDGPPLRQESQDEFISRQRAIARHIALVKCMPLDAITQMRLEVVMTGDPQKDGPFIAQALQSLSPDEQELLGLFRAAPMSKKMVAYTALAQVSAAQPQASTEAIRSNTAINTVVGSPMSTNIAIGKASRKK